MRSLFSATAFFLALITAWAQEPARTGQINERIGSLRAEGVRFQPIAILQRTAPSATTDALWQKACTKAEVLQFDPAAAATVLAKQPDFIALSIPSVNGALVLDLQKAKVVSHDLQLRSEGGGSFDLPAGIHYRGEIQGSPGSIAAISIFENEVMGILSDVSGERIIGRFDHAPEGMHVFYHENDLRATSGAVCSTTGDGRGYSAQELGSTEGARTTRCVGFYWEIAYDIVQNKGGVANATNYALGLFNQSAILYDNDGIDVVLTEVFVWDTSSPYNATSSTGRLQQFGNTRTSFNGDLAHLLDLGGYGGVAWLNVLCSSSYYRMAYSGINTSYQNVPTYSWSVEVVTHEQGHNLGSQHTHACSWNGNNTAIDGCGQSAGYNEGSCPTGPIPISSVGGTIMSYCHLTSSTIKFANGFGPQPTAVITNAINGASCLPVCGSSCNPPTVSASVANTSALIGWNNVGATSYDLQWKLGSSSFWTTVAGITGTSYQLNGLTEGTTYNFRVMSNCVGGASSAWSATGTFTTIVPCTDVHEPNNSTTAAEVIALPAALNALISSSSDVDYFQFTLDQQANIALYMTNVSDDFDVRLLNSAGSQLAISQNASTSSEYINYSNAPAGTYYVHVYGWNGTFNTQVCYSLSVSVSGAQGCNTPTNISSSNITQTSAALQWSAVQGAASYTVQWREDNAANWSTSANIAGTSHTLSGLIAGTTYNYKVRTNCAGGGSLYSAQSDLTTIADPCATGVRVGMHIWLDGAYVEAQQLMRDDLRVQGLIPLQEPYSAMGYSVEGPLSTTSSRLSTSGATAIVDWVLVELRSSSSAAQVLSTRAGLLRRDGAVVSPEDGVSQINFCSPAGSYYVSIRHRNHLACMTASALALTQNGSTIDLRNAATPTYGTNARRILNGTARAWAGNSNSDIRVKFSGQGNDRDVIIALLGGVVPTATQSGYHLADVNLDGVVQYTGASNDRDVILSTIGGIIPTNIVTEQMP